MVLAAGMSTRFGSVKQLAKFGGGALIQRALDSANESRSDYVYLVVGYDASEIVGKLNCGRAEILFNKDFSKGLSTSLRTSITNLPEDCAGALFMVADQPYLGSKQLDLMITTFRRHKDKIVALSFRREPRNPVVIPRSLFSAMLALRGDAGAKEIVRRHSVLLRLIEMKNEKVFFDIDRKSDLRKLLQIES